MTQVPSLQRRDNDLVQVLSPGSEHQQGFSFKMHGLMQEQLAQRLTEGRSARLPGDKDIFPLATQALRQPIQVGALACAIYPLKRDKFCVIFFKIIIL